jgi:uncharacterized protein
LWQAICGGPAAQRHNHAMPTPPRHRPPPANRTAVQPLSLEELDELQDLLDRVPAPLEPLDVSMLDGFLCGVLVQPQRIPDSRWLPHLTDADGRPLPARFDASRLHALARRRHAELDDAIARRQWFDPWVFELEDEESPAREVGDGDEPPPIDAVLPWVAGFATAQEFFPALMQQDAQALTEPLALLYRHLDPDDLEDADELLEEIESLEPPVDLTEAVEGLVRATLLLADVSRPVQQASSLPPSSSPRRRGPTRGTR